jgi:hypothetical protein
MKMILKVFGIGNVYETDQNSDSIIHRPDLTKSGQIVSNINKVKNLACVILFGAKRNGNCLQNILKNICVETMKK